MFHSEFRRPPSADLRRGQREFEAAGRWPLAGTHRADMPKKKRREKRVIGWREWVALPELGITAVKAKIDTGATTSSIHAIHIERFRRDGHDFARFQVHPLQRNSKKTVQAEAPLVEYRSVRSSSGHESSRPVILTTIELFGDSWPIELTLANRDQMGFRMLIGRRAMRKRFLVDPAASYLDKTHVPEPPESRRSRPPSVP